MKKALITGITGQDGSYLSEYLLEKGYEVHGMVRRSSHDTTVYIENEIDTGKIQVHYGSLRDIASIERIIEKSQPDEIYNLAAQSHVGISFTCPEETQEVNYYGVGRLVNAATAKNKNVRIYQASTSEMFGSTQPPQNEQSPFAPVSPYAVSKLKAHEDFIVGYRERHGFFCTSGILFNHESPRRGTNFVTRKITRSLARIQVGLLDVLTLGNIEAKRDWGYAGDYVKAMHAILAQDTPEDFVIGTGVTHSVRDFIEAAATALNMNITWEGKGIEEVGKDQHGNVIIRIDEKFYRPNEVDFLRADSTKAQEKLGWKPSVSFTELVAMMVQNDLKEAKKLL